MGKADGNGEHSKVLHLGAARMSSASVASYTAAMMGSSAASCTAALVNLSPEPANKVHIVCTGAVPALVELLRSGSSSPEAREHVAQALFGLPLHEVEVEDRCSESSY
jgi:hypothetical protein